MILLKTMKNELIVYIFLINILFFGFRDYIYGYLTQLILLFMFSSYLTIKLSNRHDPKIYLVNLVFGLISTMIFSVYTMINLIYFSTERYLIVVGLYMIIPIIIGAGLITVLWGWVIQFIIYIIKRTKTI